MNKNLLEPFMVTVAGMTDGTCDVCNARLPTIDKNLAYGGYDGSLMPEGVIGEVVCDECWSMLRKAFLGAVKAQPELVYLYNWTSDIKN